MILKFLVFTLQNNLFKDTGDDSSPELVACAKIAILEQRRSTYRLQ